MIWARLMSEGDRLGRPRGPLDTAAIVEAPDCIVARDNERDFERLPFVNPLRAK